MAVTLKDFYTVKPAVATWTGKMSLSELDQVGIITYVPTIYFYKPNKPENKSGMSETLRHSLSKALVYFYPLAGRLCSLGSGRFELDCNEMGVRFVEAESELNLDDLGDLLACPGLKELIPKVDYSVPVNQLPLLFVQLTMFKCGGISLSFSISHIIVDGQSALHFFSEWARISRGEPLQTPPFLDRKVVINVAVDDDEYSSKGYQPFDESEFDRPPILVGKSYNIEGPKRNTVSVFLKLTKNQVEILKKKANQGKPTNGDFKAYTRYETVTAHIWKCVCKARKHDHGQQIAIGMTADSRNRMQPPLPDRYFGNATFDVIAKCNSEELISKPLCYASCKIREAIKKVTDSYVRSIVAFLKNQKDLTRFQDLHAIRSREGHYYNNPNMAVVSWLTLPLYDMDFGWGREIYMGPGTHDFDGDSLLLPGRDEDGSIVVALCLKEEHVEDFKTYFYKDIDE